MKSRIIQGVPVPTVTDDFLKRAKELIHKTSITLRCAPEGLSSSEIDANLAAARRLRVTEMMLVIEALVANRLGHND